MPEISVPTDRGVLLNGVLFSAAKTPTVVIAITGIHGNFYSNPFYFTVAETLTQNGVDFIYAQTCDAFGRIETYNVKTKKKEIIGSWNENFADTNDDVGAYVRFAVESGYTQIVLAGHSLGANKVIHYLADTHDARVGHFLFLSPANITWLRKQATEDEKEYVRHLFETGQGQTKLPFPLFGWIDCVVDTAWQWLFADTLNNVHVEADKDFSQVSRIRHNGGMIIGTYDNFTYGKPEGFLQNINDHMTTAKENQLIFIEGTGHTYQSKDQELSRDILRLVRHWYH